MPLSRLVRSGLGALRGVLARFRGYAPDHYRLLVETTPDLVVTTTRDGRVLSANRGAALFTGDSRLVGKSFVDRAPVHERAALAEQIRAAADGESRQIEQRLTGADGATRWFLCGCHPIRQDDGQLSITVLVVARDVTARKHDEETARRVEERARHTHKMGALARLAGGIAHDFNNVLTIINSYSQFLAKGIEKGTARKEDVDEIRAAVKRAAELTNRLLAFGRGQAGQERVIDLNASVRGVEPMIRRLVDERIKIETRLADDARWVKADPAQIDQVLLNLSLNARDAMPDGGKLTIETAELTPGEVVQRGVPGLRPGYHVLLTVSDTGVGMDDETRSHLFEPFFTTKRQGEGAGLGLATVYSIIHLCGGHIEVETAPGTGARFRIYLPAEAPPPETAPKVAHRPSVPVSVVGGIETVLLVEDNQPLRELIQVILKGAGYTVLVAAHGAEALEVSKHQRGPIHLLVSDLVMPEVGGRELATRLWQTRPDLRVLFMSGYMGDDVMKQAPHGPGIGFIGKPFMPEDFIRKVRECCDGPAPTAMTLPSSLDPTRSPAKK